MRRVIAIAATDRVRIRLANQPWVKELLTKFAEDGRNNVPMDGRTHKVTQAQYDEAEEALDQPPDDVKLLGYTLIPGDV